MNKGNDDSHAVAEEKPKLEDYILYIQIGNDVYSPKEKDEEV